jgi:signal transduction histidine kinase
MRVKQREQMLLLTVVSRAAAHRGPELLQLLEEHADGRLPPGCLKREVWSLLREPGLYAVVERWTDPWSMNQHRTSDAYRALLGGIRALGVLEGMRVLREEEPDADEPPTLAHLAVHDLRNPIATASALVSAVEERLRGAGLVDEAEELRVARAECRRSSRMLSDLLLLSRIERKRFHPQRVATAVRDLLDEAARAIAARAAAARVAVDIDADGCVAPLDRELCRRLIDNLAENALRHVRAGDRIQLAAREEPERFLRIAFRNTGPEVPARVRATLFHADIVSDDGASSAGLGLYVCRLVAEAHGGTISLVARAGWDVSFEVILPISFGQRSTT